MKLNSKVYILVLATLGLNYFMLQFSSRKEMNYDESYRNQSLIIDNIEQFDVYLFYLFIHSINPTYHIGFDR